MPMMIEVLLIIGFLLLFLIILAWILPKRYSVKVSETILRPKDRVYEYVRLLGNQLQYSEWLKPDESLQPEIIGDDGTVGARMKWKSSNPDKKKNVGKGEQTILQIDENNIVAELHLLEPMEGLCTLSHHIEALTPESTQYECLFSAYARFPLNLPSYLIGRYFIRKNQQKTLANIKRILESE